jgi:hypothetical protein
MKRRLARILPYIKMPRAIILLLSNVQDNFQTAVNVEIQPSAFVSGFWAQLKHKLLNDVFEGQNTAYSLHTT